MLLRRTIPLAIAAIAAVACEPSVPFDAAKNNPSSIDYAAFDPTGSPPDIPLPNDLALQPQAIATQPPAQAALLTIWATQGFPNDQEVPITIDFVEIKIDAATGAQTRVAPQLDTSSINQSNLIILSVSTSGSGAVAYDPPKPADYVVNGDHGTLTIHKSADASNGGTRRWPANTEIVYAVRGGASGVKVSSGSAGGLQPQAAMYLLLQDKDLTLPENQSLLPGNTREEKAATGAQLETLRKGYAVPFAAIDASGAFSHHEIATMGTFKVADTAKRAHVETDASGSASGVPVPFPSQFMFDATGHLSSDAQKAFGPLGPPLATLDGFSTTAMMLAGTSSPVQAGSIAQGVFIYEIKGTTFRRLKEIAESIVGGTPTAAEYAAEPSVITEDVTTGKACTVIPYTPACVSTVIGLQPAVPAQIPVAPGLLTLPPLKENTTYVVLVTDKVKDLNGDPLTRSTLGNILMLDPGINVASGGKSTVAGVTDAQAVGIDQMRVAINGAAATLAADPLGVSRDHVVMGYTFKTQSFKSTATQLAALPYGADLNTINPVSGTTPKYYGVPCFGPPPTFTAGPCPDGVVTDVFDNYGVDTTLVPNSHIATMVEAKILTFNALDPSTGAFLDLTNPSVHPASEAITALIALPAPSCGSPPCKVPLVIYRHGIGGSRGDMIPMADAMVAQGFAVAAIDAAKQGDRSFCQADSECASGTCVAIPALAGQGDSGHTPGACMNGSTATDFVRRPVLCPSTGCATANVTEGIPTASANFIISANFFRTRDTFRQDIIDESQLIRVLSPDPTNPTCATDSTHPNGCANAILTAKTLIEIDPTQIYFIGSSLGSINGTMDVAANARISKAVFSVGGATVVDTFTNSPAFSPDVNALLAGLGIVAGTPGYLQFVNVAKWIIDPADALNYADNLSHNTLAGPLSGGAQPPARAILSQISNCDTTVPNPFNLELWGNLLTSAPGPSALTVLTHVNTGTGQPDYTWVDLAGTATSCGVPSGSDVVPVPEAVTHGGAVPHGIFTDFGCKGAPTCTVDANLSALTTTVQSDAAAFLSAGTIPPASRNAQ